ncbi:MAG: HNH endonuclease, partial [Allosphingosinicella sp.]
VLKSRGGWEAAPVHPICHRAIHASLSNKELERGFASAEALRAHPELAKFVAWVADKDPDFHAPTRRRKP